MLLHSMYCFSWPNLSLLILKSEMRLFVILTLSFNDCIWTRRVNCYLFSIFLFISVSVLKINTNKTMVTMLYDDPLDYYGTAHKKCAVAQPYFRNNVTNQCCELTKEDLEIHRDFGNISVSSCRFIKCMKQQFTL